jgi:arylsulfatase A-like enzyme
VTRPNILLITTDQHNAEILGCAGNPVARTPHIDRLAAEGILFDSAFTPHPVCTPARTSILTGLYARHHGVTYNVNTDEDKANPPGHDGLGADVPTFPQLLAENGYSTALFGKLHAVQQGGAHFGLQHTRLAEGKGQFVDYGAPPDDYRQYLLAKGYPANVWRTWEHPEYARRGHTVCPLPEEDCIDGWTASQALNYLKNVHRPFFAWVSFSNPHTPWDPPRPYDTMYDPSEIPFPARRVGELEEKHPSWVDSVARTVPAIPKRSSDPAAQGGIARAYGRFSDDQVRAMLAAYYGQIAHVDTQVGRLLAFLDERGLMEETLIVFTADHGDYLGNNWAFFKYGAFYDSLARVPLIVRWPGSVEGGSACQELVSLVDLTPTFLDAAGLAPSAPMDGRSLRPLFGEALPDWREELVLEATSVRALITREWRYMRWNDGFEELYDRRRDPHDLYNLARWPKHAGLCQALGLRLDEMNYRF